MARGDKDPVAKAPQERGRRDQPSSDTSGQNAVPTSPPQAPPPAPVPTYDDITMPIHSDQAVSTQPVMPVDTASTELDPTVSAAPPNDVLTIVTPTSTEPEVAQSQQAMQEADEDLEKAFADTEGEGEPTNAETATTATTSEPNIITLANGNSFDAAVLESALNGNAAAWNEIRGLMGQNAMTNEELDVFNANHGVAVNDLLALARSQAIGGLEVNDPAALEALLARRATDLQLEGALDLIAANMFKDGEALQDYYRTLSGSDAPAADTAVVELAGGLSQNNVFAIDRQTALLGGDDVAALFGGESVAAGWISAESADRQTAIDARVGEIAMAAANGNVDAYVELRAIYGQPTTQAELDQYAAAGGMTVQETLGIARQGALLGYGDESPLAAASDARLNTLDGLATRAAAGDTTALAQLGAALPGVTLTGEVLTSLSSGGVVGGLLGGATTASAAPTTPAATDSSAGTASAGVNLADAALDRMGDGFGTAPSSPSSPTVATSPTGEGQSGGEAATPTAPTTSAAAPTTPVEFSPDNTATTAANNLADWADGIAGQVGASGSGGDGSAPGVNTGTTTGSQLPTQPRGTVEVGDQESGFGTTTTGTTEDGRSYTQTDMGAAGFKREYDDTGTVQFFNSDGTAKGGELTLHTDAGTTEDTNPAAGTTDDDTEPPPEEEEDDGSTLDETTSEEGTAYVNPDADVVSVPLTLSPVVAQIVATGFDPTTTTPSGPYVDDTVTPLPVLTGGFTVGLNVLQKPGIVNPNPDDDGISIVGTAPPTFDPAGPDTVDPDDPLVGGGGEDINPGDFTPRPSVAMAATVGDDAFSAQLAEPAAGTSQLDTAQLGGTPLGEAHLAAGAIGGSVLGDGPEDDGFHPPG